MFSSKKIFQTSAKPSDPIDPGKIWYSRTGGANEPITFTNGYFYTAARRSTDGKSWTSLNIPQWRFLSQNALFGEAVIYQEGIYRIYEAYSYDAINWITDTPISISIRDGGDRYTVQYMGGKFYAAAIVYDNGRFARNRVYSSNTGVGDWTMVQDSFSSIDWAFQPFGKNLHNLAINQNVAVAIQLEELGPPNLHRWSPGSNRAITGFEGSIHGIGYSPELNLFVALTTQNAYTSSNGTNWTQRPLPTSGQWSQLAWNGTRFAAVHKTANIKLGIWSDDGINWNTTTDFRGSKPEITYLCGGNGNFVSGGTTYLTS